MKTIRISIASGAAAAVILIGGVASAQSAAFSSQMGIGTQSSEVTSLQTWLENNGYYSGPVTGYYGTLTQAGVENYQRAKGISATGYVGPLTLAALNGSASGSTSVSANSSEIAALEAQLNSLLAQIQAMESTSVTTTTNGTVPVASNVSLQTSENLGVSGILGATSGTAPYTYSITAGPLHGTLTSFNSTTGAFTYTPNSNYVGSDTFSYTVANSSGTSAPVTVSLNVGTTSGVPTGQTLSFSTNGSAAYNGTLTASGNSPYTYSISSQPAYGTISNFNPSSGTFTYTPNANYTGRDTFTYTVSNNVGQSSPVTVTITNNGSSSTSSTPSGQSFTLSATSGNSVNGNLGATGSGTFTYAIVTPPQHGTLTSFTPATGAFTYTPTTGYNGSDSFTYTVSNGSSTSGVATVTIND